MTNATENTTPATIETEVAATTISARIYMKASQDAIEYVRIIAPTELRPFLTRNAIWRSLKTTDLREALESAAIIAAAFQDVMQEIAYIELGETAPIVTLSAEIQAENFMELIEKANREDIDLAKADLKISFSSDTKPKKEKVTKPTKNAPADLATSKRLQAYKAKRKKTPERSKQPPQKLDRKSPTAMPVLKITG